MFVIGVITNMFITIRMFMHSWIINQNFNKILWGVI